MLPRGMPPSGMLRTVEVSSADDVRLADYTRLTDSGLRTCLEAGHGLFIAEGTKVITRAVAAGYPVRSMLLGRGRLADLPALGEAASGAPAPGVLARGVLAGGVLARGALAGELASTPVYVVPDEVAERLTGYRVHRGALASLGRLPLPGVREVIGGARRVVVLEDLVDHGNVGAIFRCAAALGVDAVVLSPRCADPLYRRSVKVSMGAVFAIPYARMTGWHDGLADLKSAGFRVLALTPDERAAPVDSAVRAAARVALLLGTEGNGLSARWLHEADDAVRIPMNPAARAAGVDSLNVVAAAAIACHLLTRDEPEVTPPTSRA
jgi:tRNA G18 (ribose-2'-O)-methylase SpoU